MSDPGKEGAGVLTGAFSRVVVDPDDRLVEELASRPCECSACINGESPDEAEFTPGGWEG